MSRRSAGVRETYEFPFVRRDGEHRWLRVAGSPLYGRGGGHVGDVGMCVDVTERRRMEEALQRLALYDALTGLPNRALLQDRLDRLDRLVADHERGAADGGRGTATRWSATAATSSSSCAPVPTSTSPRGSRRTCAAAGTALDVEGARLYVTVSMGVAATTGVATGDLLRAADAALYDAKESGRDRCVVHDACARGSTTDRLRLLTDLREAFAADALEVWYQPVMRLGSAEPVGAEALLRWTHPERGPVSPAVLSRSRRTVG